MHLGGKIFNNDLVRRIGIAETDVLKADCAVNIGKDSRFLALVRHFFTFEEVKNTVSGGRGRLHIGKPLRHLRQR